MPPSRAYLVTPGEYSMLSEKGKTVTEETWQNRDRSSARGWLLRGEPGAPAVVLLHSYGNDRSHTLNLGVRLGEATGYTVLMPDLRGHGPNPLLRNTSFGGCEGDDLSAAFDFLRGLRTQGGRELVGRKIGVYGVGIGALAALEAAAKGPGIASVLLDSVPWDSSDVVRMVAARRYPVSAVSHRFADFGARIFFYDGCFRRESACERAGRAQVESAAVFAGTDFPGMQDPTISLGRCFGPGVKLTAETDLTVSGYAITKASVSDSEDYSDRVNSFFRQSLGR